jgi:DNA-binding MarR family transcriptional regulator
MQLLPKLSISQAAPVDCAEALLDALPPVIRVVRWHMRSHRGRTLSLPQFRILAFLRAARSANLSAVAEFLGASLPTASRIVSGLVVRGLIHRREHADDRRQVELALTSRGAAAIETARRATREKLAKELESLSDTQRRELLGAMESLYEIFSADLRTGGNGQARNNGTPRMSRVASV